MRNVKDLLEEGGGDGEEKKHRETECLSIIILNVNGLNVTV